jgi:hypothetical protein
MSLVNSLFHVGRHRPWWACPDVRGLNIPYANEQLGAVLGETLGGPFGGGIGSGVGRHRPWWACPDVRGLNIPYANEQLGAVLGETLGGPFGGGIGSGVGRVAGGVQPPVARIEVGPNAWESAREGVVPFAVDHTTPVADLDCYPRRSGYAFDWGNERQNDQTGAPGIEVGYLGGISGGITDAMGFGAVGPRPNATVQQDPSRAFGGLLTDAGAAGI